MTRIRVEAVDRRRLKELKRDPMVREMAAEEGIIDDETYTLTYEQLIKLMIPDDAEVMERPEDEMSWFDAGEEGATIHDLAGENVAAHEVVSKHTNEFTEQFNIEITNV